MTTRPTEADFAQATEAHNPETGQIATRDRKLPDGNVPIYFPWRSADPFPDGVFYTGDLYLADWGFIPGPAPVPTAPTIPEWGDIPEDEREAMVERARHAFLDLGYGLTFPDHVEGALAAALTTPPTQPEWADAPAVLARAKGRPEGAPESVWIFNHLMKRWESIVGWEAQENLSDVTPLYPEGRAPEVGQ